MSTTDEPANGKSAHLEEQSAKEERLNTTTDIQENAMGDTTDKYDSARETPVEATSGTSTDTTTTTNVPAPDTEDDESSLEEHTTMVIPITNPSVFPVQRIQEVQSQHYPSTTIVTMLCHKSPSGTITQVTADINNGSINHIIIRDTRIINALSLQPPHFDTITLDTTKLKNDETFKIRILPGQRPQNLDEWIVGELVSARHAYLYWLDERQTADPKTPPFATEAKALARKLGRRWPDVMREVEGFWRLEQGSNGMRYRGDRERYLGEDPRYEEWAERGVKIWSMFG
ncbi:hypothetical protein N0V94_001184 [Neodidymelliopsis sp. IMI 364377]|nr:hypothetical protein N0V94_001184 [Neodidymelliopsis sp. IMI 364377]